MNRKRRFLYVMEYRKPGKPWKPMNRVWFTQKEAKEGLKYHGSDWKQDGYDVQITVYVSS